VVIGVIAFVVIDNLITNVKKWRPQQVTASNLCRSCALRRHVTGENNSRWNGGRRFAKNGIFLTVTPNHPFFKMAFKTGSRFQIAEHRLAIAEHLGRCLESWEIVHHINRDNYDNRLENLLLLPNQTQHQSYTLLQVRVSKLEARVTQLEAENILLGSQVKSQGIGNPELAEGSVPSGKCRDFIPPILMKDEEKVHPSRKLGDRGA